MRITPFVALPLLLVSLCATAQQLPVLAPDQTLIPPNAGNPPAAQFGRYSAIDGDTALVTLHHGPGAGRVFVYVRQTNGRWTNTATLVSPTPRPGDAFGTGVGLDRGVALIRGDKGATTGVFVFRRKVDGWFNSQFLPQLPGESFNDRVVFENKMAVIGGVQGAVPGEAYIYRMTDAKKLHRQGKISASDGVPGDGFGVRLALDPSAGTLVVGAATDQDGFAGSAYVFARTTSNQYVQTQKLVPSRPNSQLFADGLGVRGDTLVVGASNEGVAYLYRNVNGRWILRQRLAPTAEQWPEGTFDFGSAIGIGPSHIAVGALFASTAFIYSKTPAGVHAVAAIRGFTAEALPFTGTTVFVGDPFGEALRVFNLDP